MELANKQSKSILAKLLATENVTVEHGNYQTASFDVKNRVLRLPIWKEMSGSLYDLLVLHEVGHALFTPEEGMHEAKDHGRGFKSFLNVVEDARIERKIKIKYPGGRRSFIDGYNNLMERDFFGIKNLDIKTLALIDKINLHYKVGDHVDITFNEEESVFVDRIDKANTWKEVFKICEDLYEYAKENEESETDMSEHDWTETDCDGEEDWDEDYDDDDDFGDEDDVNDENDFSDDSKEKRGEANSEETDEDSDSGNSGEETEGEEGGKEGSGAGTNGGKNYDPESKTDRNFRNNESELVSEESKPYRYINLPNKVDLKTIIVPSSEIYEEYKPLYSGDEKLGYRDPISGSELMEHATATFNDFRTKNKKVIEYLAKDFELKKAAKEHARTATANSGILDSERLYTYKYNEHIFKKLNVVPDGKNHGLVMFVDWSGSMSRNMKGTIEQMLTLVMFCKRVNIPFEVYAFSDSYGKFETLEKERLYDPNGYMIDPKIKGYGTVALSRFNLLNLFSSRMRAKELHEAYIYMTATAHYYSDRYRYDRDVPYQIPEKMHLGGTPLNSTLFVSFSVMREFQKKNQVDVINSIFLTDGDSHSCSNYWISDTEMKRFDVRDENVIIRDSVSKKEIRVPRERGYRDCKTITTSLVKFQREVFDINIVNFFLATSMRKWDMIQYLNEVSDSKGVSRSEGEDPHLMMRKFRKEKYLIFPELSGFNEQYLIQGGKNLEVEDAPLEVAEDASVAQLARAFKKFSTGKLQNRKLLSRFIDMVAA